MLAQLVGEMKVNMLVAKNQLSRLVKDALAGKDVVIASNGKPMVRLCPSPARPICAVGAN